MSRKAAVKRKTSEVEVAIELNIDGKGIYEINTGIPFFDHMLEQLSKHGLFDLKITANGDTDIDFHHTVEDVGICLGEAFESALGDKKSINRYGYFSVPFDETLSSSTIDLSGRPFFIFNALIKFVVSTNSQLFGLRSRCSWIFFCQEISSYLDSDSAIYVIFLNFLAKYSAN